MKNYLHALWLRSCRHRIAIMFLVGTLLADTAPAIAQAKQAGAGSSVDSKSPYAPWVLPVMFPEGASPAVRSTAEKLSKILGQSGASAGVKNPVCCFWVEITGWAPNPGQVGFVIIFQKGGAIIQASDEKRLEEAVRQVESIRKVKEGVVHLPTNLLLTSYPTESAHDK
jgi:hypothetical protein